MSEALNGILIGRIGVGRNLATAIGNRNVISIGCLQLKIASKHLRDRIRESIPRQRETNPGRSGRTC